MAEPFEEIGSEEISRARAEESRADLKPHESAVRNEQQPASKLGNNPGLLKESAIEILDETVVLNKVSEVSKVDSANRMEI